MPGTGEWAYNVRAQIPSRPGKWQWEVGGIVETECKLSLVTRRVCTRVQNSRSSCWTVLLMGIGNVRERERRGMQG